MSVSSNKISRGRKRKRDGRLTEVGGHISVNEKHGRRKRAYTEAVNKNSELNKTFLFIFSGGKTF